MEIKPPAPISNVPVTDEFAPKEQPTLDDPCFVYGNILECDGTGNCMNSIPAAWGASKDHGGSS